MYNKEGNLITLLPTHNSTVSPPPSSTHTHRGYDYETGVSMYK